MEVAGFGIVACFGGIVLSGICACLVASMAMERFERLSVAADAKMRTRGYAGKASTGRASLRGRLGKMALVVLEQGMPLLSGLSRVLMGLRPVKRQMDTFAELATRRGVCATAVSVCDCSLATVAAATLVLWPITSSLLLASMLAIAVFLMACAMASKAMEAERAETIAALPDALNAIGVYYESGLTLMQAFEQASEETPQPLSGWLGRVSTDIRAGMSAEEALDRLKADCGIGSMAFVAVALEVQQRTGGALRPLLANAARSVSEQLEMKRFMEVKTSQARLSAKIVAAMPVILFLLMSVLDPAHASAFFESPGGIALFAVAVCLELLGLAVIRKILGFDFGEARR